MTFESWKEGVPSEIRDDPLWSMRVYRLSLFASDVSWRDAGRSGTKSARSRWQINCTGRSDPLGRM
ncbi:hypothetical protein GGP55_001186 [Salinibacter ruber]|nr:hypothetical protein [Salinibacter ruber]MCS4049776.1 hypothetical protein [Salinibacter ruber]